MSHHGRNASAILVIVLAIVLAIVLVPFAIAGRQTDAWITQLLATAADRQALTAGAAPEALTTGAASDALTAAIIAGALALDMLLPIPSSIVATSSGYLLGFGWGMLTSFLGLMAGSLLGYMAGRGASRYARRRVPSAQREQLEEIAQRWGDWALAVTRPLPVLAETAVLLAGISRFPLRRFLVVSTLSNLCVAGIYAFIGQLSASWQAPWLALVAACLLPVCAITLFGRKRSSDPVAIQ